MGPSLVGMRTAVAIATAFSLALAPVAPSLAAQVSPAPKPTAAPAKPPAAAAQPVVPGKAAAGPAPVAAPTPAPPDGGWPRGYTTPSGGKIIVYQPQVASWDQQRHVVAYAAVSYEAKGAPKPALGSIKLEADTKVSVSERLVSFHDLKITESNFPTLPKEQLREVVGEIEKAIPDEDRVIGLDRVLASVDRSQIMPKNIEGVKADPPTIFFSKKPAVLVNIDGDPIWSPIKDNDLKFAVNTNWDLFQHEPTKVYYLRNEQSWLQASDIKGPWTAAAKLPESFKKLPADDNWKDVKAALPGKKLSADKLPQVFVSTAPAEMILLAGEPKYEPVAGTGSLVWVSNTESDLFRMGPKGERLLPRGGALVLGARLHRPLDVRHAQHARGLPEDLARASALAGAGVGPGHAAGGGGGAAGAGPPDRPREQEAGEGARGQVPGRAEVREDREDQGRARRQHRQEHHQGRRHVLHVLRGRVVHGQQPERPLDGDKQGSGRDLRDPDQLARPHRHLRDGRGRRR